jgi:zinc transport system permease protein
MEYWYSIVDYALPFAWTQHLFMKNALLAILLVSPLFGILGTLVVNNRMAFFSDTIGHSALTGIAIGLLCGLADPLWAMVLFSIVLAIAISLVKYTVKASTDTIIGVFSAAAVALGIVILSRGGGFAKYSNYLIGDLLSITAQDLTLLGIILAAILALWTLFFNRLLLISVNPTLALSRGIPVRRLDIFFCIVLAVVVTVSIQWLGILIINSLLILPAAAARNVARNMSEYHLYSIAIILAAGLAGLISSYYWGTATGATIVLFAALFYAVTLLSRFRLN